MPWLGLDHTDTMQTDPTKIIEPVAWRKLHGKSGPELQYQSQPEQELIPQQVKVRVRVRLMDPPTNLGSGDGNQGGSTPPDTGVVH